MEQFIHPQVRGIEVSGIRKMASLVSQYEEVLSLTIGQPDFPTPLHIREAAKRAIDLGQTTYTPNPGLIELRQAAAAFVRLKYGLKYDPETETIVTSGASQALDMALRTILTPGSEVILPGPVYPGYEPLIRMVGATPVHADTTRTSFKLTAEVIAAKLSERTRCIILASPSNPTGAVMEKDELEDIAAILSDRDVFVISDEIYSELVYDRPHVSIAAEKGMREKTIVINGLSKSHSMTGWRIGFAFAPEYLAKHMVKVLQYNVTCASSISQHAAIEALTAGIDDAAAMREQYAARRRYVYDRLRQAGVDVHLPGGAFYLFPSIRKYGLSSEQFATQLLDRYRVAVVPGNAFSKLGEGYVRISYACAMDVLQEAMDRLIQFIQQLDS